MTSALPIGECPNCGTALDEVTSMTGSERKRPREGDLSICMNCGALLVFRSDLSMARARSSDLGDVTAEDLAQLIAYRDLIRRRGPLRRGLS